VDFNDRFIDLSGMGQLLLHPFGNAASGKRLDFRTGLHKRESAADTGGALFRVVVIDKTGIQQVRREWRVALIHGYAAYLFGYFNVSFNVPRQRGCK
jgi:hypothetical protein